jgi:putative membrane protein
MTYHRYFGGGPVGGGHHWIGALVFCVFALVVLGALAWAIIMILRQRDHQTKAGTSLAGGADARRILDERFARGEIEPDDYRARRDLLDGD